MRVAVWPRSGPRIAFATSALLAGCGGAARTSPPDAQADIQTMDVMDPCAAICATADAAGLGAAPPFDLIQQIFDDNCVSCHSPGADVNLTSGAAWGDLVNQPAPSTEACGGTLVTPASPDTSYLYEKISLAQPCSGSRMPRTEFASDPLPDCVVALVRNWIATGAPAPTADAGGN
jgi:hypothetical protein